jgi:hypothetical protein
VVRPFRGEWGIWSPGGRPAGAASSLLATPNGPFSFAVLSGRLPPPWTVEELGKREVLGGFLFCIVLSCRRFPSLRAVLVHSEAPMWFMSNAYKDSDPV